MAHQRACIIGAGSSGIVAAKVLRERGIPFDCFEMGSGVGGLWRYGNDSGRSVAYASLTANTTRDRTAYRCLPMPREWPDYPHHSQLLEYFEAFTDRFGLRERIAFRTEVVRVAPVDRRGRGVDRRGRGADRRGRAAGPGPDAGSGVAPVPASYAVFDPALDAASDAASDAGAYEVTVRHLETGEERTARYGAVLVASGHHWRPSCPELPGRFAGLQMHSSRYRTPDPVKGRRVLVVGIGNSACDISCEVAGAAERTFLSTRRGAHVLPKVLLGRPLEKWLTPLSSRLPFGVQRALFQLLLRLDRGDQEEYGIPKPPYPLGSEHPTISQELPELVREGRIAVKPDVARLAGERVVFADGTEEEVDILIFATGYDLAFPFFDGALGEELRRPPGNRLPLYLHMVPPDWPNLYFLGLVQPLGPIPPLAEAQAECVADLLEGAAALPSREGMRRAIERTERKLRSRFVATKRHTMEVEFFPYLRAVRRERRRGRRRRKRGAEG